MKQLEFADKMLGFVPQSSLRDGAIALQRNATITSTNTVQSEELQLSLFHVEPYIRMAFDQSQS